MFLKDHVYCLGEEVFVELPAVQICAWVIDAPSADLVVFHMCP